MRNIARIIGIPLLVAALVMIFMAPVVLAAPGAPGGGVNSELAAARRATTQYHDVSRAVADGYVQLSGHVPGMGAHFANLGLMETPFNLAQPEILLYSLTEGNRPKLVAVEYVVVGPEPDGLAGDSDVWEIHLASCHYPDGSEELQPDPSLCPLPAFWHPGIWALHVWIWRGNPDGVFAAFNPNVP